MAAPRGLMLFFCGRGKVAGGNNRVFRYESFESFLTEQRCSLDLPCVTFCFVSLHFRAINKKVIVRIVSPFELNMRAAAGTDHQRYQVISNYWPC